MIKPLQRGVSVIECEVMQARSVRVRWWIHVSCPAACRLVPRLVWRMSHLTCEAAAHQARHTSTFVWHEKSGFKPLRLSHRWPGIYHGLPIDPWVDWVHNPISRLHIALRPFSPEKYLGSGGRLSLESSSRYPQNRKFGSKFSVVLHCIRYTWC